MTEAEAGAIVRHLVLAYPWVEIGTETADVYVRYVMGLPDPEAAHDAVVVLVENERYFPSVAQIRTEYKAALKRRKLDVPALPDAEVTEAERAANIARVRDMSARLDGE